MKRLASILLWSVIAAAFVGPGTVTTAASAGSRFGFDLLWALVFSTVACLVLQEAAARLTVVSGANLGQALARTDPAGWRRTATLVVIVGAIVLGCAAYEAGNILGGVAGAELAVPLPRPVLTLLSAGVAALLLWRNSPRRVAISLSVLVAVMGLAFLTAAVLLRPGVGALTRAALVPTLPPGSGVLALGLIGTTVVPYNLFLGSGIAAGQRLGELRFGLAVSVLLGGGISMAVLVVGAAVEGVFDFAALAEVLARRLGAGADGLLAAGLLAAGLSSAVTAPLAAAVTARSLFARGEGDERWSERSWRYRAVWLAVLGAGLAFGLSGVRPIPAIILAQAFNGVVLPMAAAFLLLAVNDRRLMGVEHRNGALSNVVMGAVTAVTLLLGTAGVLRAATSVLGLPAPSGGLLAAVGAGVCAAAAVPLAQALRRRRAAEPAG